MTARYVLYGLLALVVVFQLVGLFFLLKAYRTVSRELEEMENRKKGSNAKT